MVRDQVARLFIEHIIHAPVLVVPHPSSNRLDKILGAYRPVPILPYMPASIHPGGDQFISQVFVRALGNDAEPAFVVGEVKATSR